jgi:septal ring factor EnvC (AmiA/AmiB activator)
MMRDMPEDERHSGPRAETFVLSRGLDLEAVRPRFDDYKQEAVRIASDAKDLTVQDQESLNIAVMLGGNAKKIGKAIDVQRKAIILEPSEFVKGVNGICKAITDQLDEAERITKQKIGQHQARVEMERRERERKAREEAEALQRKLQAEAEEANRKAAEEARKRAEEEQRIKREKEEAEARERGAKKAEMEALAKKAEEERLEAIRKAEEEAKKNEVVAPTVVSPVVQEAPKVTRTEAGSASQRKVWTFEVVNQGEVPREYMSVDVAKIREAVKMGTRSISGVRIFEETKTVFRT